MNESINQTLNESIAQIPQILGTTVPFTSSPVFDIYIITLLTSLFITLVNKYMTDQIKIKELKAEMKDLRKEHRELMIKNPKKAQKIQQEMMKKNMENMKHVMNPKIMLITMLPMIILITSLNKYYGGFGKIITYEPSFWLFWLPWGWLGTYIFFSIINSIMLKKILDVA